MLKINYLTQYRKDLKKAIKQGLDLNELKMVIEILQQQIKLPAKYRDHALRDSKHYKNCRECHIHADWLLVYRIKQKELILELVRTGTHSNIL